MKISSLDITRKSHYFGNNAINNAENTPPKREFIDKLTGAIRNQRDINDCIAVPRGVFKAYILIMSGAAVMGIANFMPKKWTFATKSLGIIGNILYLLSAIYFAKGFAFKGLSPTVDKATLKPVNVEEKA